VDIGSLNRVSEVHAASIFRIQVGRFGECSFTYPTYLNPEVGGRIYLRNIGNTAHIHTVQIPKSKINVNKKFWEELNAYVP
jgi:hypothetical protein